MSDGAEQQPTSPVTVALCVDGEFLDRLQPMLRYLLIGLIDQAIQVQLVSSDPRIEQVALGPVHIVLHPPLRWPLAGTRVDQVLETLGANPPTLVQACSMSAHTLAKSISDEFDLDLVQFISSTADVHAVARIDRRAIVRFVACAEPLAAMLESHARVPSSMIEVIRPGLFAADAPSCYADEHRQPTMVCTAGLEHALEVGRLVDALFLLRQRGRCVMAFLLGDGGDSPELRDVVRRRDLTSTVTFAQPTGDLGDVLRGADLFVEPTQADEMRLPTLQAMASGLCVIAARSPVVDFLADDETAIICTQPTTENLASALERAYDDRALAKRIAADGLAYVREHHSLSRMAEKTAAVYRRLAFTQTTFTLPP